MAEENPFAQLFNMKPSGTIASLARLAPGGPNDDIEITLTTSDPKNASYHCISYDRSHEWDSVEITVDGKPMPIPLPLEQALRAFRLVNNSVVLWADLLTGNSSEERSKQALVMKEVIENAVTVTCFLGTGSERSPEVYSTLQTLANWWQQGALHSNFPKKLSTATHRHMEEMRTSLCSRNMSDIRIADEQLWLEINSTLSSPYFMSAQAVPDIILGKKVLIRSGSGRISWDDFNKAFRALLFILPVIGKETPELVQDGFQLVASIDVSVQRREKGESLELLPMVQGACKGTSTGDPRELVFAVLPVVDPSERAKMQGREPEPLFTADYTKTVDQVFVDTARYIIEERQDLLIWWQVPSPPCLRKIRSLPSWAPDWSTPNIKSEFTVIQSPENGLRKWWDSIASPKRIFVDGDHALHVQAHALDQIESVSPVFTRENFRRLILEAWQSGTRVPGETQTQTIEKYWRAVVLDIDQDFGARIRDNIRPKSDMWVSWQSLVSEEMMLQRLQCTLEELATSPALQARARVDEVCADLGPATGKSAPIENLILRNSLGRRMFKCRSGRVGMTAIEGSTSQPSASEGTDQPRVPNFDGPLSTLMGRSMMEMFLPHLAERHPEAARTTAQAIQGQLPGQVAPGVRSGDIVSILVGGFQPYILRPVRSETAAGDFQTGSRYAFVGDCHLQGAMDGECLYDIFTGWKKIPLVDILIV